MRQETSSTHSLLETDPYNSVRCSAQVLVVDRHNGPASVLMDTLSRLLDGDLSLTEVDRRFDALQVLDCFCFDLVVIGVDNNRLVELTLLSGLRRCGRKCRCWSSARRSRFLAVRAALRRVRGAEPSTSGIGASQHSGPYQSLYRRRRAVCAG